jgi:hypothetical protein
MRPERSQTGTFRFGHSIYLYNIMIAGIPFVLAGQLKTNTPHYIHFFLILPALTSCQVGLVLILPDTTSKRVRLEKMNINEDI